MSLNPTQQNLLRLLLHYHKRVQPLETSRTVRIAIMRELQAKNLVVKLCVPDFNRDGSQYSPRRLITAWKLTTEGLKLAQELFPEQEASDCDSKSREPSHYSSAHFSKTDSPQMGEP